MLVNKKNKIAILPVILWISLSCQKDTSTNPEPTAPSVPVGIIAFYSERDGNAEIYIMNTDGSGLKRLTNNTAEDITPVISPDGKKIAFSSNRDGNDEIYVMNIDGSNLQRLTNSDSFNELPAVWSPDGSKILFSAFPIGNWEYSDIFTMNADGSNEVKIPVSGRASSWSPDGKKILFYSIKNGICQIYQMNIDGSNLQNLGNPNTDNVFPRFSPDGTKIAFGRIYPSQNYRRELWVMNSDGTNQHWINIIMGDAAEWSPDGTRLVYSNKVSDSWDLYTCRVDSSDIKRLTNTSSSEIITPSWSSDGNQIVFGTRQDEGGAIYVVNSDGTQQQQLIKMSSGIWKAMWSPDGAHIAFGAVPSDAPEHWEIYLMNSDGTNIRRVTNTPGNDTSVDPDWHPIKK